MSLDKDADKITLSFGPEVASKSLLLLSLLLMLSELVNHSLPPGLNCREKLTSLEDISMHSIEAWKLFRVPVFRVSVFWVPVFWVPVL